MLKGLRKRLAVIFTVFTGAVLTAALAASFYQSIAQTRQNRDLWFSATVDRVASTVMSNVASGEANTLYEGEYIVCVKQNGQLVQGLVAPRKQDDETTAAPVAETARLAMFAQAKDVAEAQGLTGWLMESYLSYSLGGAALPADDDITGFGMMTQPDGATDTYAFFADGSVAITISPTLGTEGVFNMEYENTRYRATYFNWTMESAGASADFYEVAVLENLDGQTRQILLDGLWYLLVWLAGLALLFIANWFLAKLVLRPTEDGMRRQTQFVAAASHELRSPLTVIRASLSAAQGAEDEGQAQKFQAAAAEEADRMSRLVDDLLLLAGGDADSWQLQSQPVDLDTLLIDAVESYAPLAREKQVRLQLHLPEETLPKVPGDAERLRQILAVLLDNALQYAPANTEITLTAGVRKGKVAIEVADRGRGVPDEEKEKVFERFYRTDKSRHDKAHFGLGLSVAQELAELHKGRLTVSDTKNGGATFTLTLPLA